MTDLREDVIAAVRFGCTFAEAWGSRVKARCRCYREKPEGTPMPLSNWHSSEGVRPRDAAARDWIIAPADATEAEIAEARSRWETRETKSPAGRPGIQSGLTIKDAIALMECHGGSVRMFSNEGGGDWVFHSSSALQMDAPCIPTQQPLHWFPRGTTVTEVEAARRRWEEGRKDVLMAGDMIESDAPAAETDDAAIPTTAIQALDHAIREEVMHAIHALTDGIPYRYDATKANRHFGIARDLEAARDLVEKWGGE